MNSFDLWLFTNKPNATPQMRSKAGARDLHALLGPDSASRVRGYSSPPPVFVLHPPFSM